MSYANILKPCAYTYSAIIAHMQDNTSPTPNKTKQNKKYNKTKNPIKNPGRSTKATGCFVYQSSSRVLDLPNFQGGLGVGVRVSQAGGACLTIKAHGEPAQGNGDR